MFKNIVNIITLLTLVYGGIRVLKIPFSSQISLAQSATTLNHFSERDRIFNWINKNMIDKTFICEKSIKPIESGQIEAEFEIHLSYSNLALTESGFSYDETRVRFQKDYQLDNNGKRTGEFQVKDQISKRRIVTSQIKSTDAIYGAVIPLSDSQPSNIAAGNTLELTLENNAFTVTSRSLELYDSYAANSTYKHGSSEDKTVYEVIDEKLKVTRNYADYDVDPQTLSRTPNGESKLLILNEFIGYNNSI